MFHLDTNACIQALNGTSRALIDRLRQHPASEIAVSAVVRAELQYSARRSRQVARNPRMIHEPPCYKRRSHAISGGPRSSLHPRTASTLPSFMGRVIGPNDLLITATARAHDAILVTHDTGEFSRVAGLAIEDWQG